MCIIILPVLPLVLLFIAVLTFFIKKSDHHQKEEMDNFWAREKKANQTLPVDLGTIAYLNVPLEKFHIGLIEDETIKSIENKLVEISKKPLLNLTGKTNTELKETYGSPNLEAMKAIGDDFDTLTLLLVEYAEALIASEHITEAITVLEYGVFIKSDVSKNYTLLADCFIRLGQPRRIETLREQVIPLHLLMEPVILKHFDDLTESIKIENEDFSV